MNIAPASWWHTAGEIAALCLPGMPQTTRRVHAYADEAGWASAVDGMGEPLVRRRAARGGGVEYHTSLFPEAAQLALLRRAEAPTGPTEPAASPDIAEAWQQLELRSAKVKAEAQRRASILKAVDDCVTLGIGKAVAVQSIAAEHGASRSAIFEWFRLVAGVPAADRVPFLAPQQGSGRTPTKIDDELWQALLSDFLRLSQPSFASSYRRIEQLAVASGKQLPAEKTLWRRVEKEVPREVMILKREGADALRQSLPAQKRTIAHLHALELVNIDGHTCDVRVQFPDGTIGRPTLIAIQDVYSRKFLTWRYAKSEDTITARLCFADLFAKYGVPKGLLSDNGRAFASKWLTGGAKTRFRGRIKEDDPVGLLTMLGITIHWALPFRGSSKPIERGFRDFCGSIAKHPAFEGAYTGNNALNKPDNYGERAVPWETFIAVWDAGIHAHNAQGKRRTETAKGASSFDQVFAASYADAPIGQAGEHAYRMALLAAEKVRADRDSGKITLLGNTYYAPALSSYAGKMLVARFDPENAHKPIHVYDTEGRYVVEAALWEATGFLDAASAKERAKLEGDLKKKTKAAAEALDLLSAHQLDAMLPTYEDEAELPEPSVVRPVRPRGATAAAIAPIHQAHVAPDRPDPIDRLVAANPRLRLVE